MASELIDTAQALLTATDTALSKAYRDEDRGWRAADLGWREAEKSFMRVIEDLGEARSSVCAHCTGVECETGTDTRLLARLPCTPADLGRCPPPCPLPPSHRQQQQEWRREDVVQRELENARALWAKYVEKNRHASGGGGQWGAWAGSSAGSNRPQPRRWSAHCVALGVHCPLYRVHRPLPPSRPGAGATWRSARSSSRPSPTCQPSSPASL